MKAHLSSIICAIALLTASNAALAHHSHGNYDVRNYTHIEGTIIDVIWLNPHIWIHLETDEGETWALEGGSIQAVTAIGWDSSDINKGERIAVRCHAQRDGSNGCLLGYIAVEGGEERVFD